MKIIPWEKFTKFEFVNYKQKYVMFCNMKIYTIPKVF